MHYLDWCFALSHKLDEYACTENRDVIWVYLNFFLWMKAIKDEMHVSKKSSLIETFVSFVFMLKYDIFFWNIYV